jgi:P-type Cu2+ transporter
MSCCVGPVALEIAAQSSDAASKKCKLEDLKCNARVLADGTVSYVLSVPSIHCGNCISTIEGSISNLSGVVSVRANLSLRRVAITLDNVERSPELIVDKLSELGFQPQTLAAEDANHMDPEFKRLLQALAISGFAATNIMLLSIPVWNGASGATRELFQFISALIAIPGVAIGGNPFFRSAASALRRARVNMDVPISLGVLLATGMSIFESLVGGGHAYFDAATSLLFFLLVGRTLDYMMRSKARAAAESLLRIAAKGGFVVQENSETVYLPLTALQPGMRIRVAAGERFPVDGAIVEGCTDVDRSIVTGESDPARLSVNDTVEAGALNLTGSVDICAARRADQSFIAEVTAMMAAAERGRSGYVRIADRLARVYAPFVHIAAATTFLGWMLWTNGDVHQSLTVAVAVLIITCPCALGLAVPVAQVISAGRLFSAGILMKDGSALERLATITNVAFDKTGTLTTGRPEISGTDLVEPLEQSLAKALASRSIHPASRALSTYLGHVPSQQLTNIREIPGQGVEAFYKDNKVRLGRGNWVGEISLRPDSRHNEGFCFALQGEQPRNITLRETLRPDAMATVLELQQRGLPVQLLSGDIQVSVAKMAANLGITDFSAGLRPGEKLDALNASSQNGGRTLMVGDGINDAPALAAAYVSMAPAPAADVGRTAADLVFTRESLQSIVFAHDVALATEKIVRQNFALAIIYNIMAVPLAVAGQLNPLLAAVAMSTSSILVVGNCLRLYRLYFKGKTGIETKQNTPKPLEMEFA